MITRTVTATIATFVWALWFGGLVALFVVATGMFAHDRNLAIQVNPTIFAIFERYQLILAAVALIAFLTWRVVGGSWLVTTMFALLCFAAAVAVVGPLTISSKMQKLAQEHQTSTPEFRKLHGYSMMLYCGEAGALLIAGMLLPAAYRERQREQKPTPAPPE